MKNLPNLSIKRFLQNELAICLLFLILGFIGFADSSYLVLKHYTNITAPCFLTTGCEIVTTSRFSKIGPIPLALLGSLYYLTIIILSALYLDRRDKNILRILGFFTIIGFTTSLYLLYVQAFILRAFCIYCLLSAATSSLLFFLGMSVLFLKKEE